MIDVAADLGVFFDAQAFGTSFARVRVGVPEVTVVGILGEEDREGFEDRALIARRQLLLPTTADVRSEDALRLLVDLPAQRLAVGAVFRVSGTPERGNDGSEMTAMLVLGGKA